MQFPFFKQLVPDLGVFYVLFAVWLLTLSSNAVNLTDGLDGLAIGTTLIAAAAFAGLAYVTSHFRFSEYLDLLHRPGRRRGDRLLRRDGGRVDRLPVVELLPGAGVHGRRGQPRARRARSARWRS